MKKIKEAISIVLILLLTLSSNAYGAQVNWDLKLLETGDAQRYYTDTSDNKILTFTPINVREAYNGETYTINTPEVYVSLKRENAPCYLNTYVDGKCIGKSEFVTGYVDGSNYYTGIVVRYLSPGEHDIEIKAYTGYPMDTTIKTVNFKVKIPVYMDKAMEKSLQKINDGTATENDYEILCINTSEIFKIGGAQKLNEKVKGQNLDINNVQSTVYRIMDELKNSKLFEDALERINAGNASLSDYSTLGIEGVTSSNLNNVNGVVKITRDEKNQDLSKEEIQQIVNEIPSKLEEANTRIDNGEGTLKDYSLVGATKVTVNNLEDVNWYVKGKDNSTLSKLQDNINTVLNALDSINSGTTSTSYYIIIGVTEVNSNNIETIAAVVKANKGKKGSDLTRTEIDQSVQYALNEVGNANIRINAGEGTLSDYVLLGITNVTEKNLEDINWYVKGKDNSTKSKLESNIGTILNALYYANVGNTSGFKTLGLEESNSNNYTAISNGLKEARNKKGSDLTRTEIVKVVEDSLANVSDANTKINGGQGTVADYKLIGITNVTEANLEDVNWYVKGKDNSTKSKLESNIGTILNALYYANVGNTSGFKTLGLEESNSNNYTAISNGLKEARNKKGSDLTRAEIIKVVNQVVNFKMNNINLMTVKQEEELEDKNDIIMEDKQIDNSKVDNKNVKIEANEDVKQDDKDLKEEKQSQKDVVINDKTENIDKDNTNTAEATNNDLESKQEVVESEKQDTKIEKTKVEEVGQKAKDNTKVPEVYEGEVNNQIIQDIAV